MLRKVDQPCRSCGKTNMTVFLDLGTTPLADRLLSAERLGQPEPGQHALGMGHELLVGVEYLKEESST